MTSHRARAAALLSPLLTVLLTACPAFAQNAPDAPRTVRPVGRDGHVLNLDFETGDLRDWTTTGAAFDGQPIKGDTVNVRRGDMHSRHAGNYWIGTYEVRADAPRGTLTSKPFKVTHPWAMFLVGCGGIGFMRRNQRRKQAMITA